MDEKDFEANEGFVSGGLAAVLRLVRIGGIAPLNFVKSGDGWRISLSKGWSVYGYIMVTAFNVVTSVSIVADMQQEREEFARKRSYTKRAVSNVQAVCMVVASWTAVFAAPRLMRPIIAGFNQVQKINSELNIRHLPASLGRNVIYMAAIQAIVCVTLSLVDYVLAILWGLQLNEKTWINAVYLFYFFSFWIVQFRNLQFIAIVLHVKFSFKLVNNNLMGILHDIDNLKTTPFSKNMSNVIKKYNRMNNYIKGLSDLAKTNAAIIDSKLASDHSTVRRLGLVYASLCDVVRDVNNVHGPMVLIILANFFLHLICTPYFFISYLLDDGSSKALSSFYEIKLATQMLWCLYHTLNLVSIVEPCHLTHMEMVKTRELVGHLMRCPRSICDPLAIELEQFFRYLLLSEVFYEPMKVIKMTRTLILTLLGSITTYTVVILHL